MIALQNSIFNIQNEEDFNTQAIETFRFQAHHLPVYRRYIQSLGVQIEDIRNYREIPFLPIDFFKTQQVIVDSYIPEIVFSSSGTTGSINSLHQVAYKEIYEQSYKLAFEQYYGPVEKLAILALLPSYLERGGSSLVYMVDDFIRQSNIEESGFFLYNHDELASILHNLKSKNIKTVLFGVTYALLDFVEVYQIDFPELVVLETGGMKGKRKEMIRPELHDILKKGFNVPNIHSEYGMTELLSQGYSYGDGIFETPPWMKILIRDTNDPLSLIESSKTGAINVIDLANLYSCSFIATQDLGKIHQNQQFEILGRFDHSDIRGCNLLVQ